MLCFYSVWTWIQHWFFKKLCGTTCYQQFLLEMAPKPPGLCARSLLTVSVGWWAYFSLRIRLSTNLACPPQHHFQRLAVSFCSKMLCSEPASCSAGEGQVWTPAGNEFTLKCCPMISTALTAQALPALLLLQSFLGNWLSFPGKQPQVPQVYRGLQSGALKERNIFWHRI